MQTNSNGEVALRYRQSVSKVVTVGENGYAFIPRLHISLAWVKPEDVNKLLAMKHDCNCGGHSKHPEFHEASALDVQLWTYGVR